MPDDRDVENLRARLRRHAELDQRSGESEPGLTYEEHVELVELRRKIYGY